MSEYPGVDEPQLWDSVERAQIYARDLWASAEAPLLFLPRGGADAIRADARAGRFSCPLPECEHPRLEVRAGPARRDHFWHSHGRVGVHAPERVMHLQAKAMLQGWLHAHRPDLTVLLEAPVGGGTRRADLLVINAAGKQLAIEVQYSALSIREWEARHADYEAAGVADIWLWGHAAPHWRAPSGPVKDPTERRVTEVMRNYTQRTGRPLIWINPEQPVMVAGRMRCDFSDEQWLAESARPLSSGFVDLRTALAIPAAMEEWTLTPSGPSNSMTRTAMTGRAQRERQEGERAKRRADTDQQAHAARLARRSRLAWTPSTKDLRPAEHGQVYVRAADEGSWMHNAAQARGPRLAIIEAVERDGPQKGFEVVKHLLRCPACRLHEWGKGITISLALEWTGIEASPLSTRHGRLAALNETACRGLLTDLHGLPTQPQPLV